MNFSGNGQQYIRAGNLNGYTNRQHGPSQGVMNQAPLSQGLSSQGLSSQGLVGQAPSSQGLTTQGLSSQGAPSQGPGSGAVSGPAGQASGGVSERLLNGQSLGYILLKVQEILRSANRALATFDLQLGLSQQNNQFGLDYYVKLFADPSFLAVLKSNSRIHYDAQLRKWSFTSPYAEYTSPEKIVEGLYSLPEGLDITQEMLELTPSMGDWIHRLLAQRQVRAVRTGKRGKCKSFSPESGYVCDIYDQRANKCDVCAQLKNLTLYSKARPDSDNIELESNDLNFQLDQDLKDLWASRQLTDMETILENIRQQERKNQMENTKRPRRKAKMSTASRVNKIANAHVYTADDFKA